VLQLAITSVTGTAPGQTPEIVFTVTIDGAPVDILSTPLTRLTATVAGPTTDYASFWQNTIQGVGSVGTLAAAAPGFRYTFPAPMPASASGTYAFGLEGYIQPGGAAGPRFVAGNPVAFASVTDAAAVPRRKVVDQAQCDSCHAGLAMGHSGSRRSVEYCPLCHNPNQTGDERIARFEGTTVTAPSLSMAVLMHRIHMGARLTQQPSVIGGFPAPTKANPAGTPIDFGAVRYPGDPRACAACHAGQSYALPLPGSRLPSKTQLLACTEDPAADADSYCDQRVVASETFIPPATAACTGCHDAPSTVAHAQTMTAPGGAEACATCHGPGAAYDVAAVHAPAP
jgi:OmcA/MtrC family decaheme c-type cytochrome